MTVLGLARRSNGTLAPKLPRLREAILEAGSYRDACEYLASVGVSLTENELSQAITGRRFLSREAEAALIRYLDLDGVQATLLGIEGPPRPGVDFELGGNHGAN